MPQIAMKRKGIEVALGRPGNLVMRAWAAEKRRSAVRTIALLALFAAATGYGQKSSPVE